jgi:hypothetical protein
MIYIWTNLLENLMGHTYNDVNLASTLRYSLEVSLSLVTRLRSKRFNEAINRLLQDT